MVKPAVLKALLSQGLGPQTKSVILFSNNEGSIIAKAGQGEVHSQAAVLANICHEYMEFGNEAFSDNSLQCLFIAHDEAMYVAKPIFSLVLCFICAPNAPLGLVRAKVEAMARELSSNLEGIKNYIEVSD